MRGQRPGDRQTDALAGAGDDRHLVSEQSRHRRPQSRDLVNLAHQ